MRRQLLGLAAFVCFLAGCRDGTVVKGAVTYEGRDVANGYITFFPVKDSAGTFGAPIVDGKYEVNDMPPGSKRVHIRSLPVAETSKGNHPQLKVGPDSVPDNAVGNDQIVEIAGNQTLDVHLRKRAK